MVTILLLAAVEKKLSVSKTSFSQLSAMSAPADIFWVVPLVIFHPLVLPAEPAAGVVHVGVPPVLSSVCPDVPIARQTGVPTLEATSMAPLVGMLQAARDDTVEYVITAPLVGTANHEGRPPTPPTNTPPSVCGSH